MQWALLKAGFVAVRRARFQDCEDDHFRLVEDAGRFRDFDADIEECAMEARKPAG